MIGGEGNGHDNTIYGTIHYSDRFGQWKHTGKMKKLREGIMADEYHTITIEWYPDTIKWFLDDVMYQQEDISANDRTELQENFFLILNVAVGGNWPGNPDESTVFPQRMLVDYIRVYKDTLE
jgi:beta-glucanase (GH16 family)